MKIHHAIVLLWSSIKHVEGFSTNYLPAFRLKTGQNNYSTSTSTSLKVSVGLGPDEKQKIVDQSDANTDESNLAEVVEEPDHELFRTSRLTDFDKKCDEWFEALLGNHASHLGEVSDDALQKIRTLVELKKPAIVPIDDENWTPYQQNLLPGSPILPSYGLEQYGLPIPRRNAEAWRHFDLPGLIACDYSLVPDGIGSNLDIDNHDKVNQYKEILKTKGAWVDDDDCAGRLVYINGRYVPSLSKSSDIAKNLSPSDFSTGGDVSTNNDLLCKIKRLTDGFTDRLAADVPVGDSDFWTSYKALSSPNHNVGEPTSQFAINGQHGTACFVALNSARTGSVAYINIPASTKGNDDDNDDQKRVLVINAVTSDGGVLSSDADRTKGVASHPRSLVCVGENSKLSFLQTSVDLDVGDESEEKNFRQKFVNGVTQMYISKGAKVSHSYLEESGGIVTPGVEAGSEEEDDGQDGDDARGIESKRNQLRNTYFETIDAHVAGDDASYEGAIMSVGGNGRTKVAVSATLLRPGAFASINGFSLSGGAQRSDMKTLIHHIAQGTTSRQNQRNMIGGRATNSFRGRIRVEQSAQQTDSEQLTRNILLSDKSRVWAIPSLEIIADDVKCTHGATVSDLSEEELFYLRSRGLDRTAARNILMYAFVDDVANNIDSSLHGVKDSPLSLKNRVISRLQNVVPQGDRKVRGEFQSV